MCENIYEISVVFSVEFVDTSGDLQSVKVPVLGASGGVNAVSEFSIKGDVIKADGQDARYSKGRVVSVDLSITVLSDTGMRLIRQVPLDDPQKQAKFLSENSYNYSKTVLLPQP
jgi:hypothetical protein